MKKLGLFPFILLALSCVHQEYDMSGDKLNLEIAPFQEGVTLPLGGTGDIRLEELLKNVDSSFFSVGQDGSYIIGIHDSISMDDELSSITEMIDIPDVDFSQKISFQLSNIDASDIKVDAMDFTYEVDLGGSLALPDMELPAISDRFIADAGMTGYVPDAEQMELALDPITHDATLIKISNNYSVTDANDTPISLTSGALADHITTTPHVDLNARLSISLTLPDGINSVEEITLNENAAIKVSVEIEGNLLESGNISPDVTMDFSDIFTLKDNPSGIINLKDQLVLSASNSYKSHATYNISDLNVTGSDWTRQGNGPLTLNKDFLVPVDGEFLLDNLMTTTNRISLNRETEIHLIAEFVDVVIEDVKMGIEPHPIVKENTADIDLDIKNIPAEIEQISDMTLTDASGIDIIITANNMDRIPGVSTELESLEVTFPDIMIVDGADAGNKITFTDIDITNGATEHINVTGIILPAPENGEIVLTRQIEVKASAKAYGSIHSADLPANDDDDIHIIIDVASDFEIADYNVKISGYDYPLDIEDEDISIDIPDDMSSLDEIIIEPEGEPELTIDLNFPSNSLDIVAADGGLKLSFPQMIKFHNIPASYNHDIATNSITLYGELPERIALPIERVILEPEQDPVDMKFYARGKLQFDGAVAIAAGTLSKAEMEDITSPDNTVSIIAHIPEIVPSTFELDEYVSNIDQEVDLTLMKAEDVPAELVSISRIDLYDTKINMQLDASTLPDMGPSSIISVDMDVQLPDMVHVIGADDSGIVKISGQVDEKGLINLEPIEISHLDLEGVDIKKEGISCKVIIDGVVKLTDATVDIDEIQGQDLEVMFNADMKDILIEKILGKVDYAVEPIIQEIDLSSFSSMLGDTTSGMNATLDFCHAHLAFEIITNLGVPIDAEIELIPYYDGEPDDRKTISTSLTLEPSESADELNVTRYYLAQDDERCPNGYTFVKANILNIIRNMPDKLELKLYANTDTKAVCILEPMADYILQANYAFELPLEFGEDFEVVYKTVISGIPSIIGNILSMGNKVKLAGTFENGLPLGLDLKLKFIDSDGNYIPIEDGACVQYIKPCDSDASAVSTDLDILVALKEGVQADITSLELEFNASPGDVVGVPVTDQAYLKADLKAVLPEGVKVDLKDIFNNED